MLVETFDANSNLRKVLFAPSVPVADAGTVDLSASTYADPAVATFTYSNIPAAQFNVDLRQTLAGTHGLLTQTFESSVVTAGGAQITAAVPSGTGAIAINDTTLRVGSFSQQDIIDWAPFSATYALDMAGVLLPDFGAPPAFDVAGHRVTWTQTGATADPDLSMTSFSVNRTTTFWNWTIAAPYAAGEIVLPVLPTDVADFNANATDTTNIFSLYSAKVPNGYGAVRPVILSVEQPQAIDLAIGGVLDGTNGRVVMTQFSQLAAVARRHHRL
jgi:hypothetical protein